MTNQSHKSRERFLRARLARNLAFARAHMLIERMWKAIWPGLALMGAYVGLGLLGVWTAAPVFIHILAFITTLSLAGGLCWQRLQKLELPKERDARRRLEADNKVLHRPIDAACDVPALSDAAGMVLWKQHRKAMIEKAAHLRPKLPNLSLVLEDPRALRAAVLLVLFIGFLYSGSDALRRINHALLPPLSRAPETIALDAWITPPEYTEKGPVILHSSQNGPVRTIEKQEAVEVPAGSVLEIRLGGGAALPRLSLKDREIDFETVGDEDHRLKAVPDRSGRLTVLQAGYKRLDLPLRVIPDEPPQVGFTGPPGVSQRQALKVEYTLFDDYGVEGVKLRLLPEDIEAEAIELDLQGGDSFGEPQTRISYEDLTAHPYAGQLVRATLSASDAAGNEATSEPITFRLPERSFTHPVAKELAAIRKKMLADPARGFKLAGRIDEVSRDLGPYEGDFTVFGALRSAYWRLGVDSAVDAVFQVAAILWETALRLEDGQLSLSMRDLRDALDQFEQAMNGDVSALNDAADALEGMMQQFLSQMARQQGELAPRRTNTDAQDQQIVGSNILQQMIQQMRDLAAAGETQAAMRMLEQLREIMENATTNTMTAEDYERLMETQRAAKALEELSQQQRDVLNDTSRQTLMNRLRERRGQSPESFDQLGETQQSLAETLDEIMQGLGEAGVDLPGALDDARKAMGSAGKALSDQSGPGAVRGQAQAMTALEDARSQLEQAMQQAMSRMPSGNGLDPLGRPQPGFNTRGFELPDVLDARQAERILEELRRRISDPDLSDEERKYLRRLLRRF